MKPPKRLLSLIEEGLIDTVVRQLMSGKEATVYVVRSGGETLCAKIYKEATQRSFRQAVDYTENRKVRNSRQARAELDGRVEQAEAELKSAGAAVLARRVDVSKAGEMEALAKAVAERFGAPASASP